MSEKSLMERIRESADQRRMGLNAYLRYAKQADNNLSSDEQWAVLNMKAALKRYGRRA